MNEIPYRHGMGEAMPQGADHHQPSVRRVAINAGKGCDPTMAARINPIIDPRTPLEKLGSDNITVGAIPDRVGPRKSSTDRQRANARQTGRSLARRNRSPAMIAATSDRLASTSKFENAGRCLKRPEFCHLALTS
jgi:hypothetical protein